MYLAIIARRQEPWIIIGGRQPEVIQIGRHTQRGAYSFSPEGIDAVGPVVAPLPSGVRIYNSFRPALIAAYCGHDRFLRSAVAR